MGFDLENEQCIKFLDQWYAQAKDGRSFRGPWKNDVNQCSPDKRVLGHRHDQSVGSVIAWDIGMRDWMEGTESFLHYHNWQKQPDQKCVLWTKGCL
jgi:hypothetical protein